MRSFRLLAEVLLIGVLVCLAALPVVTVLAASAAGATLLTDLVAGEKTPSVRRFLALSGAAARDPVGLLAPAGLVVVGGLDVLAVLGGLPGGRAFGLLLGAVLAGLLITGLRAAARWRPQSRWRDVLSAAATDTAVDWPGSLMIAAAVAVVAMVVASAPAFMVIAPGLLVLAAVAVTRRHRPHAGRDCPRSQRDHGRHVGPHPPPAGRRDRRGRAVPAPRHGRRPAGARGDR